MTTDELSATRKRVGEILKEMAELVDLALDRTPMLKGGLHPFKRRCGKPNCTCTRGQLHVCTVLAYRGAGKQRILYPDEGDLKLLRELTRCYQYCRQSRARLGKLFRELMSLIAVLERERLQAGEEKFRRTQTGKEVK